MVWRDKEQKGPEAVALPPAARPTSVDDVARAEAQATGGPVVSQAQPNRGYQNISSNSAYNADIVKAYVRATATFLMQLYAEDHMGEDGQMVPPADHKYTHSAEERAGELNGLTYIVTLTNPQAIWPDTPKQTDTLLTYTEKIADLTVTERGVANLEGYWTWSHDKLRGKKQVKRTDIQGESQTELDATFARLVEDAYIAFTGVPLAGRRLFPTLKEQLTPSVTNGTETQAPLEQLV